LKIFGADVCTSANLWLSEILEGTLDSTPDVCTCMHHLLDVELQM